MEGEEWAGAGTLKWATEPNWIKFMILFALLSLCGSTVKKIRNFEKRDVQELGKLQVYSWQGSWSMASCCHVGVVVSRAIIPLRYCTVNRERAVAATFSWKRPHEDSYKKQTVLNGNKWRALWNSVAESNLHLWRPVPRHDKCTVLDRGTSCGSIVRRPGAHVPLQRFDSDGYDRNLFD